MNGYMQVSQYFMLENDIVEISLHVTFTQTLASIIKPRNNVYRLSQIQLRVNK